MIVQLYATWALVSLAIGTVYMFVDACGGFRLPWWPFMAFVVPPIVSLFLILLGAALYAVWL
jgi:hypothetical protein